MLKNVQLNLPINKVAHMTHDPHLMIAVHGVLGMITLDRASHLNALSQTMMQQITAQLEQ